MTNREFLNKVIAETTDADVAAHAVAELEKLDTRNAKRAERNSKKAEENKPIKDKLLSLLTSEPTPASTLAKATGLSTAKVSSMLRQMALDEEDYATVGVIDIKVPKKGKQKGYFVA